jgi:hypothetical protein
MSHIILSFREFIQNIFCTPSIMTIMQEIQGDSSLRQTFASSGMAAFGMTGSFYLTGWRERAAIARNRHIIKVFSNRRSFPPPKQKKQQCHPERSEGSPGLFTIWLK